MKSVVTILGAIITIFFAVLWWCNIVSEPLYTIVSGVATLIGHLLTPECKSSKDITQTHSGVGDNVGGDKVTNNYDN